MPKTGKSDLPRLEGVALSHNSQDRSSDYCRPKSAWECCTFHGSGHYPE